MKKQECCGCGACAAICPFEAITMRTDREGFRYPKIDKTKCTHCKRCLSVCCMRKRNVSLREPRNIYALKYKSLKKRALSQSGGAFSAFAENILAQGGKVYGAAKWKPKQGVRHIEASDQKGLEPIRGSKYIQSDMSGVFQKISAQLKAGETILFSGTPCQCAALRLYCEKAGNDLDSLYLCEVVCHGVPTPKIWEEYIAFIEKVKRKKVVNAVFRDKKKGWRSSSATLTFSDNSEFTRNYFNILFINNYISRPSCYACPYAAKERHADITAGDFWGIEKFHRRFDDNMGISLVLINTPKGEYLFKSLSNNNVSVIESSYDKCSWAQTTLRHSHVEPKDREDFWRLYRQKGIYGILKKYAGFSLIKELFSRS